MRFAMIVSSVLVVLGFRALTRRASAQTPAAGKRIVVAARVMFDGKGHVLHDTRIVIEGPKIVAIDPKAGPVDYDLRALTVLPGWIDAHVHINSLWGKDGTKASLTRHLGERRPPELGYAF